MTMKKTLIASAVMASIFIAPAAFAFKEYPAGEPVTMNEMELAATTTRAKNRKAPSCRWLPAMARTMARTSK